MNMKRLALLLAILLTPAAWAQWSIAPRTLENSKVYAYEIPKLKRDVAYKWVISVRGTANLIVRVSSSLGAVSSGYMRLDTIVIPNPGSTGFTDFTLTMTGDSLQNMLLPDDTGSLGTAGALLKAKDGWKGRLEVVTMASGNGGILVVADGVGASYAPPPDNDTYAYTRWIATIDYVTPEQLSDSLDHIPRTASAGSAAAVADSLDRETSIGSRSARRISDSLALRALAEGDSLARHYLRLGDSLTARYIQLQSWVIARNYLAIAALTDSLNANVFRAPKTGAEFPYGSGIRSVLTWLMEDSSLTRGGIWAGNATFPGPYSDPLLNFGINMDRSNVHAGSIGWALENKYDNGGGYMSEAHLNFYAPNSVLPVRLLTTIGSHRSGRGIDLGFNVDRLYLRSGGGQSTSDDSTLFKADPPKDGAVGSFNLLNGYLDFDMSTSTFTLMRVLADTAGAANSPIADVNSRVVTFGAEGNASDYYRIVGAKLAAGKAVVSVNRWTGKLELTGSAIERDTSIFGKAAGEVATKGYVDTRIAGASFVTATQLADSLKKLPYALHTPGPLGYVWKMLPNGVMGWAPDSAGGGGSVDTTKFVSMDRDDIIKGDKQFNAAITSYANTGGKLILYPGLGYSIGLASGETWIATDNSAGNSIGFGRSAAGATLGVRWVTMKDARTGFGKISEKSAVEVLGGVRADSGFYTQANITEITRRTEYIDSTGWVVFDSVSSAMPRRYRVVSHTLPTGLYTGRRQGVIELEVEIGNPNGSVIDVWIRTDSTNGASIGAADFDATVIRTNATYVGTRAIYNLNTMTGQGLEKQNPQGLGGWGTNAAFTFSGVGSSYGTTKLVFSDNGAGTLRIRLRAYYSITHGATSALPVYFTEQ